jgi:dCTP deaminase
VGCLCDWQIERDVVIRPFVKSQQAKGTISYGVSSMGYDMRVGWKFKIFTPTYSTEIDPKNFNDKVFVDIDLSPQKHSWSRALNTSYRCRVCHTLAEGDGGPSPFEPIASETCPAVEQPMNFIRIPPNSYCLAMSVEYFEIPRDVIGVVLGKSSYARAGIIVNCTPMEAEWKGYLTIEISNAAPLPARIYAGEGIAQVLFFRTDGYREFVEKGLLQFLGETHAGNEEHPAFYIEGGLTEAILKRATCKVSYADRKGRYDGQTEITLPFVEKE